MSEVILHLDEDGTGWHVEDAQFDGSPVDPRILLRLLMTAIGVPPGNTFRSTMVLPLDPA
jgi:hypothetical protein